MFVVFVDISNLFSFFVQALKKIHTLNSQISDYQHMGHQITAMFEWMKHTDATLHARLKDDVVADDVPGEAEVDFARKQLFRIGFCFVR